MADAARELGHRARPAGTVNADDARARIAAAEPEAVVVCAFGALIKEPLLSDHELLNVHPSLLPRWRGAAPIERAIMAGDAETGVSIMRLTAGSTPGPVCLRGARADRAATTPTARSRRGCRSSARGCWSQALDERPPCVEQAEDGVTYAEKIGRRGPHAGPAAPPAVENERVVRALHPHIGARIELPGGTFLGVRAARAATGDARLELLEVQPRRRPPDGLRGLPARPRAGARRRLMRPSPARGVAHRVVRRVFEEGAYADRAFRGEAAELDARDRAFAMQLAYGTVQRRATLDHGSPARLADGQARAAACAPRCGSASTSCSTSTASPITPRSRESVELAKPQPRRQGRQRGAAPRRSARASSCPADDTPEGAAIRHSHPEWLVRLWWDWLGPDEHARAAGGRQRAGRARAARQHARRPTTARARRDPELPEALVLDGPLDVFATPQWAAGAIMPQSRARCSSRARSTRSRASACSTCARRPAARRRTSPR